MKATLITALILIFAFTGYSQTQAAPRYEQTMISSGNNYPDFSFYKDSLDILLVSLHQNTPPENFQKKYGWSSERYTHAITFLQHKGFVKKSGSAFVPSCMIINHKEGNWFVNVSTSIATQIADSVAAIIPTIKQLYSATSLSHFANYNTASFFLLSDVLLDNWQIDNIEARFIKKGRTLHNGKRYYYCFWENLKPDKEAFGIYGNQYFKNFAVYGDNRIHVNKDSILQHIANLPRIDSADNALLQKCADMFFPQLLAILKNNKAYFQKLYTHSQYPHEVSFEEFFIWYYHFMYTKTTDMLYRRHLLQIPAGGNFYYISAS